MIRDSKQLITVFKGGLICSVWVLMNTGFLSGSPFPQTTPDNTEDTASSDSIELRYPIKDQTHNPYHSDEGHPFDLGRPSNMNRSIEIDSSLNNLQIQNRVGDVAIGEEKEMPLDEYVEENSKRAQRNYFKERSQSQNYVQEDDQGMLPEMDLGDDLLEEIMSGGIIDLQPRGSAQLTFKGDFNRVENPAWSIEQQRTAQFKFDQNIKVNVNGTIADRFDIGLNYDTESQFQFDNEVNINYEGKEDEIVQSLEAGDINMPVPNSLIKGSRSLFGVKSEMKFGHLTITSVFSQKRSQQKNISVENGAQRQEFEVTVDDYDENQHFFLAQYFRDEFNSSMSELPILNSQVRITNIQVWVTNRERQNQNTRDVVGFMDLGEPDPYNEEVGDFIQGTDQPYPGNDANNLYSKLTENPRFRDQSTVNQALENLNNSNPDANFQNGRDYVKIDNARKLRPNQYSINDQLGYISLDQSLRDDEVLAVAFEYSVNGEDYQVGEIAGDQNSDPEDPSVLFLKLLKSYSPRTNTPMWDLMMKNVYSIGGRQLQQEGFRLQVLYQNDANRADLNYLPVNDEPELAGQQLLKVLNADQINKQNKAIQDGRFDFIPNVTVQPNNGRIIFPVVEPFGDHLRQQFQEPESEKADNYVYDALYDSIQFLAQEDAEHNKFVLSGRYESSVGNEISLNAINIPENSVRVTAGGIELQEGTDYTVDYTLGRVTILNDQILNSGQEINVSLESDEPFSNRQKTMMGTHLDYEVSDNFNLGGTFMYLREMPMTQKTNTGSEPVANVMWGLNGSYQKESRFLTQMVDNIPLIQTKAKSNISLQGEFANMIPGNPNVIGSNGVSYLDDFEGSETTIDLRSPREWELASPPQKQPDLIPQAGVTNDLASNYQRAKLAWYQIDNLFFRNNRNTPDHVQQDVAMQSNHYMREVKETEVFPNRQIPSGVPATLNTFDLAYFPNERGPYNFNAEAMQEDGTLRNPEDKWGGVMRSIQQSNFRANNIEYLEFWMMDPFAYDDNREGGDLYINIGNISEDILKDGAKSFENGLPPDGSRDPSQVRETAWGYVPVSSPINFAFDNDPSSRPNQDIGLDGLTDEEEEEFFDSVFLQQIAQQHGEGSEAYQQALNDPSGDNFQFYRGGNLNDQRANIIERYQDFNNPEGNSPTPDQWPNDYSNSGSNNPDAEDINNDFTLNQLEEYYQYRIQITPEMLNEGQNYITDAADRNVELKNGNREEITWYRFKIPVREYDQRVGNIQGFTSMRFMRMFMTGFQDSLICRFGQMNLVQSEWRRYSEDLGKKGERVPEDPIDTSSFDISTVNIEENGQRAPIPYVLPPDIQREVEYNTSELLEQNEQSLALDVCNLSNGDSRAAYKRTGQDIRRYKNLKMYTHLESQEQDLEDGELWLFVRFGIDMQQNYYEYAIPLQETKGGTQNPEEIWPDANRINLKLEKLYNTKIQRDQQGRSLTEPYEINEPNGKGRITILGNPDLSDIQTMMIGVRNMNADRNPESNLRRPICAEVWVNELRVTDFDNNGGWAARGRAKAKLADLGDVTLSGNRETVGFGGLEESLMERSMEDITGFNFRTSLNLGKFFPENSGVRVPMFYSHSEEIARPQYNPLNEDILLDTRLELAQSEEERDSLLKRSERFTKQESFSLNNVRKTRTGNNEDRTIFDIENFSATYNFTKHYMRNVDLRYNVEKTHRGMLNYDYNFQSEPIRPFENLGNADILKPITDFNFNPLPSSVSFSTELMRRYNEWQDRNNGVGSELQPFFDKDFTMKRIYNLRWNLTKSLNLNFQATANAVIDEPYGRIETEEDRDSVRQNLLNLGRPQRYNQRLNLTYEVPIQKFPMMDWVSLSTSYDGNYRWQAAPPARDELGNLITNSQDVQLNGQLNLTRLYNKVEFFKTINQGRDNVKRIEEKKLDEKIAKWQELKDNPDTSVGDKPTMADVSVNEPLIETAEILSQLLMSVQNTSFNYTVSEGMGLPGYIHEPDYLGQDAGARSPGLGFAFGSQRDIRERAAREGWLTRDTGQSRFFTRTFQENFSAQALVEPVNNMRINLDFSKRSTRNLQEIFRYSQQEDDFSSFNNQVRGTHSVSYITLSTAFISQNDDNTSPVFKQFEENRETIANRLSETGIIDDSTDFPKGYPPYSQKVLIPAFQAAYKGQDASDVSLGFFPEIPAPNWRLSYNGLSNLILTDLTQSINVNHGYQSTYTISNFFTNQDHEEDQNVNELEEGGKIEPEYQINQVQISEQLSPLIGIDITWENDWSTRLEYSIRRTLNFSLNNNQLREMKSNEFTLGAGYRTQELELPFRVDGQRVVLENDLNFRFDMSIRDNITMIRKLDEENPDPTRGNLSIEIRPNLDYQLSENLNLRIFFNRTINEPAVSTSYPRRNTNFGFSLRYTLGG